MRRMISLLLVLVLGLQLLLPVQAQELDLPLDTESSSDELLPDTDSPDEYSAPQNQDEPAQNTASTLEGEIVPVSAESESSLLSIPAKEEDTAPDESSEDNDADRLYNGQEADYEDPQFLKLLEDGFFDRSDDDGIAVASESDSASVSHNSRFNGYDILQGVDLSKWNSISSWSSLAQEVDFAIIRCGNRTTSGGSLSEDPKFHEYMQAAQAAGLDVGVYIYSQAITEEEAREEANLALKMCKDYSFRLPIVIDYEYYTSGRLLEANLTKTQRTNICRAFCEVVESAGYPAMIYANKSMLIDDMYGEQLAQDGYEIWIAHWVRSTDYAYTYSYWQYTDSGTVNGISGNVDMNYYYKLPEAKLKGIYCAATGVHLYWDQVSLADQYRIYRKEEGDAAWTEIGSVTGSDSLSYLDQTAQEGISYRYAVQSCDSTVRALYDRTGTAVTYQPEISLTGATKESGGVRLTWTAMNGYDGYRIFRRNGNSETWSVLADISDPDQTSYLDTQVSSASGDGVYFYTICGLNNGQQSDFDPCGLKVIWLDAPTLVSATTGSSGMTVKWKAVDYAQGYYVYRKENGKWNRIATVKNGSTTSYQDTAANVFGTTYVYTVVAYADGERSGYDNNGISGLCMETPELESAKSEKNGIQINWKPAALAERYQVYRKEENSSWSRIATVTDSTSFLDTSAEFGISYTYTVRSAASNGLSWYNAKGVSALRLATPAPKTPSRISASSVKIIWPAVASAVKYKVYRRTTGSWQSLGTTTDTSFVDTTPMTANTTYYYTVRAYDASSAASDYQSPGVAFHNLSTPALLGTSSCSNGIEVRWSEVEGAAQYILYRKTAGKSWNRIAILKDSCSYVDTSVSSGVTYIYSVRASCQNGLSWYDSQGIPGMFLSAPQLKKATLGTKGVSVTWQPVSGAKGYYVYRKEGNGNWTRLASVSGTSYLDDSQLSSGVSYRYTVRAYSGNLLGDFDRNGLRYLHLDTPLAAAIINSSAGIQLRWDSVAGAKQYIIYRKTAGTGWSRLSIVDGLTYTDATAVSGTTYIYTLRASADGQLSLYNTTGYACLRLENPELNLAEQTSTGVRVSWNPVSGADGYRIYRKTEGTGWKLLGCVSTTRFVDTDSLTESALYHYTVRAYSEKTLGSYDTVGLAIQILAQPVLTGAENQTDGILVSWSPVAGAENYCVYRKTEGSSWSAIGTCSDAFYLDQTVEDGIAYTYTIRACSDQGKSWYDPNGISCLRLVQN
ncbi:MAG: GH25 family lysozyme [Candidatus Onthomonas sp.]